MSAPTITIPTELLVDLLLDRRKVSSDEKKQLVDNMTDEINNWDYDSEEMTYSAISSSFQDHLFDTVDIL